MTDTKGFKVTTTKCLHCGKDFRCYRVTKPPGFCSGGCQYLRERALQNARRQRAREKAAQAETPSADTPLYTTDSIVQ